MIYQNKIKKLTPPTDEQVKRFVDYLLDAHSWHKHLPLLNGEKFTVFLESDIENYYFPEKHPKIPFGNHFGYINSFGCLSYQRVSDEYIEQDFGNTYIPHDLKENWSFILYPYCRWEYIDLFSNYFVQDFEKLVESQSHEQKEQLTELYQTIKERDLLLNEILTKEESDKLLQFDDYDLIDKNTLSSLSESCQKYITLDKQVFDIKNILFNIEKQKVIDAVQRLLSDHAELQSQNNQDIEFEADDLQSIELVKLLVLDNHSDDAIALLKRILKQQDDTYFINHKLFPNIYFASKQGVFDNHLTELKAILMEFYSLDCLEPNIVGCIANIMWSNCRDFEATTEIYENATKKHPHFYHLHCDYANFLWMGVKDLTKAKEIYKKVNQEQPSTGLYAGNYAQFLCSIEEFELAKNYLKIALKNHDNIISLKLEILTFAYVFFESEFPNALAELLELLHASTSNRTKSETFDVIRKAYKVSKTKNLIIGNILVDMIQENIDLHQGMLQIEQY